MNFITIDFETATEKRSSPCEIGLTFVKRGKITETKSWLIRPVNNEFRPFNTHIHGIGPEQVENAPEFDELWPELKPLIEGQYLIAHNAAFDMSVLRRTLELYDIPFPEFRYLCSYLFSKKIWTELSAYNLKALCTLNGIDFEHHRAGDDSRATAELCLKAFEAVSATSINDFAKKLNVRVGKIYKHGDYDPCRYRTSYSPPDTGEEQERICYVPESRTTECDSTDSIFYGKKVVFTGTLFSMTREAASQRIVNLGGIVEKKVKKDTDYLIIGERDYRTVDEAGMSTKHKRATELTGKGRHIELMSEYDFISKLKINFL
ncbi:MAG: hypothetical protein LBH60_04250 [Prevotellaceae bacterium]|jgi:DNA polymerase-3 subunit epsilon|nr:hypothetical protein [Prevotellaceae bacterium]